MTEITDQSIQFFLDELAGKAATPGGGGAAALMGAMSAALISMVCHLTIGKSNYASVQTDMQALLESAEVLRTRLTAMIKADADVFDRVMASYAMPKESENDKAIRSAAIQSALKEATQVPLDCAKACAEVIQLSREAAEKGNLNVVTDAGVAVMAAYGALKSAALNVYVNASAIQDSEFADAKLTELENVLRGAELAGEEIYLSVKEKL